MRLRVLLLCASTLAMGQSWVEGEIGYRVTVIPEGSVASRIGLRVGDVLAEPGVLPRRLREAAAEGAEIPLFRFDGAGAYKREALRVAFATGEERRLGTTGDLGFLITGVKAGSLAARAELKTWDFLPKIDETFVHSVEDLKLVDAAYEKGAQVHIHFTRWFGEHGGFKNAVSRRRFVK
ncbi:MAG: hypothetical protein HY820_33300 [Acidobacteria bacterium]|nr:hypothetical protein [Acidobacteriota bacterium]